MLLPDSDFSNDSREFGIYGSFGFEFKTKTGMVSPVLCFIELGASSIFIEATADKMAGEPIYFHGFHTTAGIRYHF